VLDAIPSHARLILTAKAIQTSSDSSRTNEQFIRRVRRRLITPLTIAACALVTVATAGMWYRSQTVADMIAVPVGRACTLKLTVADGGVRVAVDLAPLRRAEWIKLRGAAVDYPFVRIPEDRLRRALGVDCQWLTNPGFASEAAVVFPLVFVVVAPAMAAACVAWRRSRHRSSAPGFPLHASPRRKGHRKVGYSK
jgi:hypothetical protein